MQSFVGSLDLAVDMRRFHWFRGLVLLIVGAVLGMGGALAYVMKTAPLVEQRRVPLPQNPPVEVTFGEPFLTVILRDALHSQVPQLSNLVVTSNDGYLDARANVDFFGQKTSAHVTLRPRLVAGRIAIDVSRMMVGTVEIPIETMLERELDHRLAALLEGLPVTVTAINVVRARGLIVSCSIDVASLAPFADP